MQAALDLAEQGFKVYLVERKSAIGGHMAQLDKTFPTNDCAMCTISPRLVDVARHPNIEILTNTEVLEVQGQAGNFRLLVEQHPRYIDLQRCTACGDCARVCPVMVPDTFNEGLSARRAAYKLYPQAVPNAYAIEKRGIAPCRDACPAHQRAQGYIALIREGRWEEALRVIKMDNPFPGICGRICNHRCEAACNRGLVDEPINIRALKRFVTDKVYSQPRRPPPPAEIKYPDRRVAIIGAGPCGLTAAQDIIRAGYPVTVFEAMPVAGGMLRLGVPEFRLPAAIVDREVQDILDLGVELRLNTPVTNLDDVFAEGFSAVVIAVGAHEGVRLPIPGANLKRVLINTHFLRDVRLGRSEQLRELGERVLVLGGGNVAVDVARTALRLGRKVAMACVEDREHMPAHPWEIEAAQQEGVEIYNSRAFERILDDGQGGVAGLECTLVRSFHFDEQGRLHVEKIPGSTHVIPCDTIIFSVGQRAGLAFIPPDAQIGLTERRTIAVNPNTFATTRPGVFAAGDSVSGTAFVIEAVASGHKVAQSVLRYLRGEPLEPVPMPPLPVVRLSRTEIEERLARGEIRPQRRVPMPQLPPEARKSSFAEVEQGYDDESAQREAARCLACGICSECMSCTFACGVQAIDHEMLSQRRALQVGAILLTPGYRPYQAEQAAEFGLGRYPNVVTSLQFERLLSSCGPTMGHLERPSDGRPPRRIAFLQCVGSRDRLHDYCSAVCCMAATKQAIIAKEHQPGVDVHIFLMDLRAFSKGYLAYFERARQHYGVHYHTSRPSAVWEDPQTHDLLVHYIEPGDEKPHTETFDLVVLSVGMEIAPEVRELGRRLGIQLDEYGFCHTSPFRPLETSRPGIYVAGTFREPKDIPESVIEASGAAAAIAALLHPSRFTLTTKPEYPPERDVRGEKPRVGVFVCSCGSNIGGYVDVQAVTEYARSLPYVVHAEANLYTCSQDSIRRITDHIRTLGLNRVVVASCTPLTHAPLFQDALRMAGLNPHLFEMANIRNQCSWVHSEDREAATRKAKDLVRAAVARALWLEAHTPLQIGLEKAALIVGGGLAGMTAALALADQGFLVHLVEKEEALGGNLRRLTALMPSPAPSREAEALPVSPLLDEWIRRVREHPRIHLHLQTQVVATRGFVGHFVTTLENAHRERFEITHGVTLLACGAQEYRDNEYGYGSDARILTQQELEARLGEWESGPPHHSDLAPRAVVMIQCVGPAERYCARICCAEALKNALRLKRLFPACQVSVLYRDLRVYGFRERLYREARRLGVRFLRYDFENRPHVLPTAEGITVQVWDKDLKCTLELSADYLVLSMPLVARPEAQQLASLFKVPLDKDGFFLEAHIKLRPLDFAGEGLFMAGAAHYPAFVEETIVQAQAAAARAARLLSHDFLTAGERVAVVNQEKCTACLTCVRICPFGVPRIESQAVGVGGVRGAAYIEAAICQGCGVCVAECPARAIQLRDYTDLQIQSKVQALLRPVLEVSL